MNVGCIPLGIPCSLLMFFGGQSELNGCVLKLRIEETVYGLAMNGGTHHGQGRQTYWLTNGCGKYS